MTYSYVACLIHTRHDSLACAMIQIYVPSNRERPVNWTTSMEPREDVMKRERKRCVHVPTLRSNITNSSPSAIVWMCVRGCVRDKAPVAHTFVCTRVKDLLHLPSHVHVLVRVCVSECECVVCVCVRACVCLCVEVRARAVAFAVCIGD